MGILENLLASLMFAVLGALLYRYIYLPFKAKMNALSRILPFRHGAPITICYGLVDVAELFSIEEGDLSAITLADGTLADNYGRNMVKTYSYQALAGRLNEIDNLFVVSGPRWNHVTRHYLGVLGSPIMFDHRSETLLVAPNGGSNRTLRTKHRQSGAISECYGVVMVGRVELADQHRQNIVICAGINSISTFASIVFLMGLHNRIAIRQITSLSPIARSRDRQKFAIVLRVTSIVPPATVVSHVPLDPSLVRVEVVDILKAEHFREPFVLEYEKALPR